MPSESYATRIAGEWNTTDEANGSVSYVTRFDLEARYASHLGLGESLIATDTLRRRYLGDPRPAHLLAATPSS